ncbi:uncharacterized protein G2W53_019180 [Senna tora]|uniref:Uncharacterized protein n=1 Tax=Senna tora TaxID=362788 RepID=A0A834TWI3_9FABA|nr:uncharacterized protein G2W53_019180 [Senna tora]
MQYLDDDELWLWKQNPAFEDSEGRGQRLDQVMRESKSKHALVNWGNEEDNVAISKDASFLLNLAIAHLIASTVIKSEAEGEGDMSVAVKVS